MASLQPMKPLGVDYHVYLGVIWAGTAVSVIFVACRIASRFRGTGRIYWDDGFAVVATILMVVTAALWQWAAKDMFYTIDVEAGLAPFAAIFLERVHNWVTASLIIELFYYVILLLIKLSFLFFFGRLGKGTQSFKWIWWTVLGFIAISFLVSVGDVDYGCLTETGLENMMRCNTRERIDKTAITMEVNCFFDIFSDLLIMMIPSVLLWKVRLPLRRRIAIISLLSLSLVTMIIATARTIMVSSTRRHGSNFDVSWLYLWTAIEPVVAIIVCSLSAFPQLFKASSSQARPSQQSSQIYLRMLLSRFRTKSTRPSSNWSDIEAAKADDGRASQSSNCSQPAGVYKPTHNIRVFRGESPQMETSDIGDGIKYNVQYSVSSSEAGK